MHVSLCPCQLCGVMVSASEDCTPSIIYHCVLRGLERLLLSEQLSRMDGEALVKLSVDRVNASSPHRAMAALGLMLTCMYTGKLPSDSPDAARRWKRRLVTGAAATHLNAHLHEHPLTPQRTALCVCKVLHPSPQL